MIFGSHLFFCRQVMAEAIMLGLIRLIDTVIFSFSLN